MQRFEYIMSALSMCGFNYHTPLNVEVLNEYFKDSPYKLGLLFNAMTERGEGERYYGTYNYSSLMADSGGLQIVTLGLNAEETKKKREEIYKIQSQFSTKAMCFDEIPVEISHKIQGVPRRLDISNRYFIKEKIEKSALNTAENIKRQIEVFAEMDSKSKVMIIAHGNCKESYKQYVETIVNLLPDDMFPYIGGIAPAGTSNGTGTLDRWDTLFSIKEWNVPEHLKKDLHLLGVGSAEVLLPIAGAKNFFSFIDNISFDSSTAPRLYTIDGKGLRKERFDKTKTKEEIQSQYLEIILKYKKYFSMVPDWNMEGFMENCTFWSSNNTKDVWLYRNRELMNYNSLALLLWCFVPIWEYESVMGKIEKMTQTNYPLLNSINSYDDYLYLRKDLIRTFRLKTNKLRAVDSKEDMTNDIEMKKIITELF